MSLTGILDVLAADPAIAGALEAASSGPVGARSQLDLTAPAGVRPFVVAALASRANRPVLLVTATGREAEDLTTALRSLLPEHAVADFPAW